MQVIRAVIVDDEFHSGNLLMKILEQEHPYVRIVGQAANIGDAVELIEEVRPMLVFLDVRLGRESGFELLERIRDVQFETIFITAHHEFALKAIKSDAADYLLKPVDLKDLKDAMAKVAKKIATRPVGSSSDQIENLTTVLKSFNKPIDKIAIPSADGFVMLPVSEIIYATSDSNYTVFYLTNDRKITSAYTLRQYETMLSPQDFFRAHKSFLVNMSHINCYLKTDGGVLMMSNGKAVEISRRNKDRLMKLLRW
jgi:two-component system, LytTR family, response regulator